MSDLDDLIVATREGNGPPIHDEPRRVEPRDRLARLKTLLRAIGDVREITDRRVVTRTRETDQQIAMLRLWEGSLSMCITELEQLDIDRLLRDSEILRESSIVEIAVANKTGSVSEYMEHWEGRALRAEGEVQRLTEELATERRC